MIMYETTADLMQDWCDSRIDADLEMAEMVRYAREAEADRLAGNCHHVGAGVGFRAEAFYPQQVGLSQGQSYCYDCEQVHSVAADCHACGLDRYNCMGERGYGDSCSVPHDAFVTPPMILVSVAPAVGF